MKYTLTLNVRCFISLVLFVYAPFTLQVAVPRLVFLGGGTAPGSPNFVQDVHTTGRQPLIGHSFFTVNTSKMTYCKRWSLRSKLC